MKLFTSIMESLELDKSLDRQLVEAADLYGETPESGTAETAEFIADTLEDEATVETGTNEGGNGTVEVGEVPESGTAETAKFEDDTRKESSKDAVVEEINKEAGEGEEVYGEEPKQNIPATGEELKEAEETEEEPVSEETPVEEPETEENGAETVEQPEEVEEENKVCEPKSIEIELDKDGTGINEVEITFACQPNEEDVKAAIEKFCGEEFFTVLEPVGEETEDGEFKYVYQFKEFNRDEDLVKQAEALEDESEVEGE